MEIRSLRALLTEKDLNDLAAKHSPADMPVKDIAVKIAGNELAVTGVYPMFVKVKFELTWEIGVREGKAAVKLTACKAFGMPGSMIKGIVMKTVTTAVKNEAAVTVDGDTILVDVDRLLTKNGLATTTNLTAITCRDGGLWIEAEKT